MKTTQDTAEQLATTHGSPRTFVRMFKPQFAPLVEAGTKCQTVRPVPKRMPRPGDIISLRCWTGKPYRSPQRVLREATITSVQPIILTAHGGLKVQGVDWIAGAQDIFARRDGFANFAEMEAWFVANHGRPVEGLRFEGVLISWANDQAH